MTTIQPHAQAIPGAPDHIRIGLPYALRIAIIAIPVMILGMESLLYSISAYPKPFPWWEMVAALLLGVAGVRVIGMGVDLTPEAAILRGWRRRVVPWTEVDGVVAERVGGSTVACLYLTERRRVRLQAPTGGSFKSSKRFQPQFHTIGQYWTAHRGWTEPDSGSEPGAEPAGQPEQVYFCRETGHYKEAYLTTSLGALAATAPATKLADSASVLARVGAGATLIPPLLVCEILALIFGLNARRQLRDHGMATTAKIRATILASIAMMVVCAGFWGTIALIIFG
ncbi:MAG TPA: hypothetical protein VGX23_13710 [Actinocrinis sp.]|nr:hypothetical protein [Actinocrinis sp.]